MVHDVTEAQTQIRAAAPYAMKGDAVMAALPAWRGRLEEMAAKAPGKPVAQVKLLAPVARPSKLVAAPTNWLQVRASRHGFSALCNAARTTRRASRALAFTMLQSNVMIFSTTEFEEFISTRSIVLTRRGRSSTVLG